MGLARVFLALTAGRRATAEPGPLLVELMRRPGDERGWARGAFPFSYRLSDRSGTPFYEVGCELSIDALLGLRRVVRDVSEELDPGAVDPLTFKRLVGVLNELSAERLASLGVRSKIRELAELCAYEAIGLSRVLALAKDDRVTEFFVDSESSPVYLDHAAAGRCESEMVLTERERDALRTHVDTFGGYTLDYKTPSMKNDVSMAGAVLRISLDLEPLSVNRFALDVRRMNVSTLSLPQLIRLGVISEEAGALLVGWLESGGNVTIIGETGTGKTTLLNALDEQVERRLRRLYIEDAVETKDLLELGYHQMKLRVDPFDRGEYSERTKESEIVKALHRSPDIVILSEIQSEGHSRAFFQALASGARGIQTFHASTVEQAIRRWVSMHHVAERSLLDLGIFVQMARPDRLKQGRFVQRVCEMTTDGDVPRVRELFARDRSFALRRVADPGRPLPPQGADPDRFRSRVDRAREKLGGAP